MNKSESPTLRELREQNKNTAAEVAEVLGVSVRAVSRYEQGTRRIGLEQIIKLMDFYHCTAEEIIWAQLKSCQ